MNFDFTAALNDPAYDELLGEMHETESEIDGAYDAMGKWETHPDLAVASHPKVRNGTMSRRERRTLYRERTHARKGLGLIDLFHDQDSSGALRHS